MNAKDGGPAFARPMSRFSTDEWSEDQRGMSLRDYFAAHAMQGLLASETAKENTYAAKAVADYAYEQADRMLEKRKDK